VLSENAGVDREEVHALSRLLAAGGDDVLGGELFDGLVDDHLIDWDGPERGRAVLDEVASAAVDMTAGGQVHNRVGAVLQGDVEFGQLAGFVGVERRGADVGVDLGGDGPADGDGLEATFEVNDVGRDDHAAGGDLVADEIGAYRLGSGDEPHRLGNDPFTCLFNLRHFPIDRQASDRSPERLLISHVAMLYYRYPLSPFVSKSQFFRGVEQEVRHGVAAITSFGRRCYGPCPNDDGPTRSG